MIPLPKKILSGTSLTHPAPNNTAGDSVSARLERAIERGAGGLMTLNNAEIQQALREMKEKHPEFTVLPVIPNVPEFVREATEYGMAGAGIRRLLRVGFMGAVRLGIFGVFKAPAVLLQRDFPTILSVLFELEMNEFRKFNPPAVFLQNQMADLLLALNNRRAFAMFAEQARDRYGAEPGVLTVNFVRMAEKLKEWDVKIRLICAPFNRDQFLMPDIGDVTGDESYAPILESGKFQLIADRISIHSPTPDDALEWALNSGAASSAIVSC